MTILTIFIFLLILILLLIISLIIINSTQFSYKVGGYRGGGDSDDEYDENLQSAIESAKSVIASPHKTSPQPTADSANTNKLTKDLENATANIYLMEEEINKNNEQISNLESKLSDSEYLQNKLTYQIEDLNTEIKELNTEIEKNKQIIEAFTTNAEKNNNKSGNNRDRSFQEIQSFKDEIEKLKSEIAKKEQTIESLIKDANDFNSKSTSNQDAIRNLKRDNAALLGNIDKLKINKEKITSFLQASLETINSINYKLEISNSAKRNMVKKIEDALGVSNY